MALCGSCGAVMVKLFWSDCSPLVPHPAFGLLPRLFAGEGGQRPDEGKLVRMKRSSP